jgi:hypothetical protein
LGITLYSTLKVIGRFGGTCSFHVRGRRISQAKKQQLLQADFFLGLLFDPHDESDMFPKTSVDFRRTSRRKNSLW